MNQQSFVYNKSVSQIFPNYNKSSEKAFGIRIPIPVSEKTSVLKKRSAESSLENYSLNPCKKNKILTSNEKSYMFDSNYQHLMKMNDMNDSSKPKVHPTNFVDMHLLNNLSFHLLKRQEMQMRCQSMLLRHAINNAVHVYSKKMNESTQQVKEENESYVGLDKEDASTTFPLDEKSSSIGSQTELENGKTDSGIHSPSNYHDDAFSIKEEFHNSDPTPITEPAICAITKLHPDWDLIRILDFYCRGKAIEEPKNRTLRSKETKASETEAENQEIDEFLSEDEVSNLMKELNMKLEKFLGFSNLDQEKVFKILDKNGMDIKKTMSLIKKNSKFYKKYFQADETS